MNHLAAARLVALQVNTGPVFYWLCKNPFQLSS